MKAKFWLLTIASSAALIGLDAASAQTTSPAAGASAPRGSPEAASAPAAVEEILVTAERRATALSRTPLAVTKLDAEQLERSDIRSLESLQFYVPGLVAGQGTAFTTLRGVGTSQPGSAVEAGVATNIDGVYVGRASATAAYFDLDSVEVLRGPQGTLYGRNATGGAINIISARPSQEFSGAVTAIAGNFNRQRLEGVLSGPISDDVGARLAVFSDQRDSYIDNILPGGPKIRDEEAVGARGSLRFGAKPGGARLDVIVDYTKISSAGNVPQYISGGIAASAPAPRVFTTDPSKVAQSIDNRSDREMFGANVTASIPLGELTFRSISGYRTNERGALSSGLPTSDNRSFTITDESARQFSQEFQILSSDEGRFKWVAGAYYFQERVDAGYETKAFLADLPVLLLFGIPNFTLFPVRYEEFLPQNFKSKSWAAYAQGTYSFTQTLRGTAGIRYTRDSKVGTGGAVDARLVDLTPGGLGVLLSGPLLGGAASVDGSWEAVTPRVGVEYDVTPSTLAYASATRGYKPGNSNLTYGSPSVRPEFVWAYEAGLKSKLFDNRAQLNLAAYHYDYTDMQVFGVVARPGGGFSAAFQNAAEAKISGVDVELLARPIERLQVNVTYGYLDAKYGQFLKSDEFLDANVLAPATPINLDGRRLQRAPEHTVNLGAEYAAPLGGSFELTPRVEYSYRSKTFPTEFEHPETAIPGYSLWNARLTLRKTDANWRVAIFGNNLADEQYFAIVNESQAGAASGTYGAPRTFGIEVGATF